MNVHVGREDQTFQTDDISRFLAHLRLYAEGSNPHVTGRSEK